MPAYLGLSQFKDANGITNIEKAKKYLQDVRETLRNAKGTSLALEKEIINRPLVPSEMFLRNTGNIFPVAELRERLGKIEEENQWNTLEKVVELYFDPEAKHFNGVNYKIDVAKKLKPINSFP